MTTSTAVYINHSTFAAFIDFQNASKWLDRNLLFTTSNVRISMTIFTWLLMQYMITHCPKVCLPRLPILSPPTTDPANHDHQSCLPRPPILSTTITNPVYHDHQSCLPLPPILSTTTTNPAYLDHQSCLPRPPILSTSTTNHVYRDHQSCLPRPPILSTLTQTIICSVYTNHRLPMIEFHSSLVSNSFGRMVSGFISRSPFTTWLLNATFPADRKRTLMPDASARFHPVSLCD